MRPVLFATLMVISACTSAPRATLAAATAAQSATAVPTPRLVLEVPTEKATLKTYAIAPLDTDSTITAKLDPHFVAFDPGTPQRGQLFLFLTGMPQHPRRGRSSFARRRRTASTRSASATRRSTTARSARRIPTRPATRSCDSS